MQAIDLPLAGCLRAAACVLLATGTLLVLLSPVPWTWRLGWIVCWLAGGLATWRHYSRTRPVRLLFDVDGGLRCVLANGSQTQVAHCQPGIVRPWLVSARLVGVEGQASDLFVPGRTLPPAVHWAMRRALIAFRAPDSEL